MFPCKSLVVACVGVSALMAGQAHALLVLTIDITNPAEVKFIATTNVSQANSTLSIALEGITIQNFFKSAVTVPGSTTGSGNLKPSTSSFVYGGLGTFNYEANDGNFGLGNDLSMYSNGGAPPSNSQVFSTSSQAFSGTFTVDFSAYAAALPTVGTTGDVITGFFQSGTAGHGLTIGQYTVIPEPSAMLATALGAFGMWARRRR